MSTFFRFLLRRYLIVPLKPGASRLGATVNSGLLIPMLGVAAGVFSFVVVLSIMSGFVDGLRGRLLALEPHLEIVGLSHGQESLFQSQIKIIEEIEEYNKHAHKLKGVIPVIKGEAVVRSAARASTGLLFGIDPERAQKYLNWKKFVGEGSLLLLKHRGTREGQVPPETFGRAIIGSELARELLRVDVGERVTLLSPIPEEGPGGLAPTQLPVVIADTISSQHGIVDSKWIVVSLETAQQFLSAPNQWSALYIQMENPLEADAVAAELTPLVERYSLKIRPWTENNKALLRALRLERWGMGFVTFVIILVGCFSITITLVLSVKRKAREMALLRSLGLTRHHLSALFLAQGACVGAIGVGLGLAGAFATLHVLKRVPIPLAAFSYGNKPLPVLMNVTDIILVSLGSLLLASIAAVWPAWEVGRINVVETLGERQS